MTRRQVNPYIELGMDAFDPLPIHDELRDEMRGPPVRSAWSDLVGPHAPSSAPLPPLWPHAPYMYMYMSPSCVLAEAFALTARRWAVICDAGRDTLLIPRLLTWSTEPRSREYLNAKDLNLDHSYFASAYPPYGEEGERLARARNPFLSPRCPLPSRAAGSDEAGPSTAHEPRKRPLFQEAAREADFQEDFPVFSEVAEALRAAASGTVVGAPEEYSDALDP